MAGEIDVDDLARRDFGAAAIFEGRTFAAAIASRVALRQPVIGEIDRDDRHRGERDELGEGGAAVGIVVAPEDEFGEALVFGGDSGVAVGIELGEGLETVPGMATAREHRAVPERLVARVDHAVAIVVEREPRRLRGGPIRRHAAIVARGEIEGVIARGELHRFTSEAQHERRVASVGEPRRHACLELARLVPHVPVGRR